MGNKRTYRGDRGGKSVDSVPLTAPAPTPPPAHGPNDGPKPANGLDFSSEAEVR